MVDAKPDMVAEDGFSKEEVEEMRSRLKEVGLVTFLRDYLNLPTGGVDDEMPSLRKLLLGFGIVPVSPPCHSSSNVTCPTTPISV